MKPLMDLDLEDEDKINNNNFNNNNNRKLIIKKCELLTKQKSSTNPKYLIANKVELIDLNNNIISNLTATTTKTTTRINKRNSYIPDIFKVTHNLFVENQKRANISFERIVIMNSNTNTNSNTSLSTNSSNTSSTSSLADPNKIHLFVKAGQDGRSQGACPFCQSVFLQLLIKAQTNKFNFDVITINMDNPPKEFKELSIKPPVLIHGSSKLLETSGTSSSTSSSNEDLSATTTNSTTQAIILSDVDEIAEYLDNLYPNSKLIVTNPEAKKVSLNVFSKFSFFIRDVASKSNGLEAELDKIDNYLKDLFKQNQQHKSTSYLNGKQMSLLDCILLPKLQHIRVAGESIKQFRIPNKFKYLWQYIQNAYNSDAFQKSCPPDREIIWNWSKSFLSQKDLLQIIQEAPYKTLSLPEDLVI